MGGLQKGFLLAALLLVFFSLHALPFLFLSLPLSPFLPLLLALILPSSSLLSSPTESEAEVNIDQKGFN